MDAMKANQGHGEYVIDPRDYRTDRLYAGCLILFWFIWVPLTAMVTYLAFTDPQPFFFIWLVFGYLGTFLVPYALFIRNRKQTLKVAGESLVVFGTGILPASSVQIRKQDLHALTLEHYDDNFDKDSVYSLNIFQKPGARPKRIMLASFVHPKAKAVLLEEIRVFLHNHGFVFDFKNEMTTTMNAEPDAPADADRPRS